MAQWFDYTSLKKKIPGSKPAISTIYPVIYPAITHDTHCDSCKTLQINTLIKTLFF